MAEGDGPVNALDAALRKALVRFYPQLAANEARRLQGPHHRLARSGTAAKTRVFIESSDGDTTWATVGVSYDIIEASWLALRDSVDYLLAALSSSPSPFRSFRNSV